MSANDPPAAPFGSVFAPTMATARWENQAWQGTVLEPVAPLAMHPATHVFHYGSACFEGLKAHRNQDGGVHIYRLDTHVERMQQSTGLVMLPDPGRDRLWNMIIDTVKANIDHVPDTPGSLYIRPTMIGTENNIGAAGRPTNEALLYILTSPVGDYFAGGLRPLKIAIETTVRTTPQFGRVKCGANYVMALGITMNAKVEYGVDQVLFVPDGDVQETGAANFLLIDDNRVVTKGLDPSFLHGVTRASVLQIAADLGYQVEERDISLDEVLAWSKNGEAALSGTAAVLAPVGAFVHKGETITVGGGGIGPNTLRLRKALTDLHQGIAEDKHGWLTPVG